MNANIRDALEVLNRATLQVLYERHVNGLDKVPHRQYLGIKEVRERLGYPGLENIPTT